VLNSIIYLPVKHALFSQFRVLGLLQCHFIYVTVVEFACWLKWCGEGERRVESANTGLYHWSQTLSGITLS